MPVCKVVCPKGDDMGAPPGVPGKPPRPPKDGLPEEAGKALPGVTEEKEEPAPNDAPKFNPAVFEAPKPPKGAGAAVVLCPKLNIPDGVCAEDWAAGAELMPEFCPNEKVGAELTAVDRDEPNAEDVAAGRGDPKAFLFEEPKGMVCGRDPKALERGVAPKADVEEAIGALPNVLLPEEPNEVPRID